MKQFENMFAISIISKSAGIGLQVGLERKMDSEEKELDVIYALGANALMTFCASVGYSCPACLAEELKHFINNGREEVKKGTPEGENFSRSISHTAVMALALQTLNYGRLMEMEENFQVDLDDLSDCDHRGVCLKDEQQDQPLH